MLRPRERLCGARLVTELFLQGCPLPPNEVAVRPLNFGQPYPTSPTREIRVLAGDEELLTRFAEFFADYLAEERLDPGALAPEDFARMQRLGWPGLDELLITERALLERVLRTAMYDLLVALVDGWPGRPARYVLNEVRGVHALTGKICIVAGALDLGANVPEADTAGRSA